MGFDKMTASQARKFREEKKEEDEEAHVEKEREQRRIESTRKSKWEKEGEMKANEQREGIERASETFNESRERIR